MTYSLVSMPVLGYDLCRLEGGPEVAQVLLGALRLGDAELVTVARKHPGFAHRLRWQQVERAGSARPAVLDQLRAINHTQAGEVLTGPVSMMHTLERSTIGDLDSLVRMVRDDVLDWTWTTHGTLRVQNPTATQAADVIVEALAAAYCGEVLPSQLTAELREPWQDAVATFPAVEYDLGPQSDLLDHVLARLALLGETERASLRAATGLAANRAHWAEAVHEASWAVYLTDRIRPAATAQLLGVQAFRRAGFTAQDGAYGVWNIISGLIQSLVVADLLGDEHSDTLRSAWEAAVGEL